MLPLSFAKATWLWIKMLSPALCTPSGPHLNCTRVQTGRRITLAARISNHVKIPLQVGEHPPSNEKVGKARSIRGKFCYSEVAPAYYSSKDLLQDLRSLYWQKWTSCSRSTKQNKNSLVNASFASVTVPTVRIFSVRAVWVTNQTLSHPCVTKYASTVL